MAVSDHLGLYLPVREDYISVKRDLSDNFEIIDKSAEMLEKGIAIPVDGDTAPSNLTAGQYIVLKNHSTLPAGAYHVTANISSGAAVAGSISPDSDGLANALNSKLTKIYDKAYGSISNNDSTKYYVVVDSTPLQTIGNGATEILAISVVGFSGFGNLSTFISPSNIVLDDGKLCFMFNKGNTFGGLSITVRYLYR